MDLASASPAPEIPGCGPAIGLSGDITNRASVKAMLRQAFLAFGGVDHIIVTAGVFVAPDKTGHVTDDQWRFTFDVNVMGSYIVADEARPYFNAQGLKGSICLTTSVNAVVSKKGSVAYDTSKAAANHLVRELAIELSPLVRVNAVAPATVVAGSTMFPRDRVIASLVKYEITHAESETTEELRNKLAEFYAQRTLTKLPILPRRSGRSGLLAGFECVEQDYGSGDSRRRWSARSVPALIDRFRSHAWRISLRP